MALKAHRHGSRAQSPTQSSTVREPAAEYITDWPDDAPTPLFTDEELEWLQAIPNT